VPQRVTPRDKWYHRTVVVALSLLFLYPIGVILLWTSPRTGAFTKVMATAIFAFLWLAVIRSGNHDRVGGSASAGVGGESVQAESAMQVQMGKLLSEYKTNEVRADTAYKGKWITTTGIVGEVKKDILGSVFVTVGTGADFEIPTVQCFVASDQIQNVSRYSGGNRVTISGRVDGLMMNVIVKDCRFQ
jgi:hypothetical protein